MNKSIRSHPLCLPASVLCSLPWTGWISHIKTLTTKITWWWKYNEKINLWNSLISRPTLFSRLCIIKSIMKRINYNIKTLDGKAYMLGTSEKKARTLTFATAGQLFIHHLLSCHHAIQTNTKERIRVKRKKKKVTRR